MIFNEKRRRAGSAASFSVHESIDPHSKESQRYGSLDRGEPILVIGGDSETRGLLSNVLGKDYKLIFATDAKAVLEELNTNSEPELIIADIIFTRTDGFRLLEEIQKDERYRAIPLIIVSDRKSPEDRLKGLESGAIDYVCKPFSVMELSAKIKSILAQRRYQKERIVRDMKDRIRALPATIGKKINTNTNDRYIDFGFTKREIEVAEYLLTGLEHKEIAYSLHVSARTIDAHVYNIYKKTGARNKADFHKIIRT